MTVNSPLDVTVTALPDSDNILYWASDDGFGVRGGENDEIDQIEQLSVEFSSNWLLLGVFLSDLFNETNDGPGNNIPEKAVIELYLSGSLLNTFIFSSDNNLAGNENNPKAKNPGVAYRK